MRAVVQRVSRASVEVDGKVVGAIQQGLLVLVGVEHEDTEDDANWLAVKIASLRIFSDDDGLMNRSVVDIRSSLLVVSQFTLHAKTKKGARPSFVKAAKPEYAIPLYQHFVDSLKRETGDDIQTGEFGAMMDVSLVNSGPVTIFIDTKSKE